MVPYTHQRHLRHRGFLLRRSTSGFSDTDDSASAASKTSLCRIIISVSCGVVSGNADAEFLASETSAMSDTGLIWKEFFRNGISGVRYSADSESAVFETPLIANQLCLILR